MVIYGDVYICMHGKSFFHFSIILKVFFSRITKYPNLIMKIIMKCKLESKRPIAKFDSLKSRGRPNSITI